MTSTIDFNGLQEWSSPIRRAEYVVEVDDDRFTVTVGVPEAVAGSLDEATRRDDEDLDAFRRRVEEALTDYGRDYVGQLVADPQRRSSAADRGRYDHVVAGDDLYRMRELLRG